jgi:hypothetical protein
VAFGPKSVQRNNNSAGASSSYNFPIGSQLTQILLDQLQPGIDLQKQVLTAGFSAEAIDDFRTSLSLSGQYSVDAFLEYRREFIDIGKVAMAAVFIAREQIACLNPSNGQHWYK